MAADLVSLDAVKARLGTDVVDAADDDLIRGLIRSASGMVTQYTKRVFVPVVATRAFDARGEHISSMALTIEQDLLEIVTLTNGNAVAIPSSAYVLRPSNRWPKNRIELLTSGNVMFEYVLDWQEAISIAGWWGYHNAWDQAWVDTLDTVQVDLTANATALTVSDADGRDDTWQTRFPIGSYLRIEDELLQVMAADTGTDILTVLRGRQGTTAAAHSIGESISRYAPMPDVAEAAAALVLWLYKNKDSLGDKIQFLDGTTVLTNLAPGHIKDTLDSYRTIRFGG